MPVSKDFTGHDLLSSYIDGIKAGRDQTSDFKGRASANKALQKMFDYMKKDMGISVEEYFT